MNFFMLFQAIIFSAWNWANKISNVFYHCVLKQIMIIKNILKLHAFKCNFDNLLFKSYFYHLKTGRNITNVIHTIANIED